MTFCDPTAGIVKWDMTGRDGHIQGQTGIGIDGLFLENIILDEHMYMSTFFLIFSELA